MRPPLIHVGVGPTSYPPHLTGPISYPRKRGTHHLSISPRGTHLTAGRIDPRPCPPTHRRPLLPLSPFFLFFGDLVQMSTSSATHSKWRRYGLVPLTRCPDCPCPEPLKRLVTMTDDNGNLGREFVKCLSKTMAGSDGKVRSRFLTRSFTAVCSDFSIFCFFPANLEFRVHIVVFRS